MFQDTSMNNDSPNGDETNNDTKQSEEANLSLPLHTLIDNGCDRIKKELETIRAYNNTLLIEHQKMATERNELERKCQVSYERYFVMFMEMSRQREAVNRLESIINNCSPFLSTDKQLEIADSIYRAKQFTPEDLKRFAEQQVDVGRTISLSNDNIHLNQNHTEGKIAELSLAQTTLTNLVVQLLLLNANKLNDGSSKSEDIVHNRSGNVKPSNSLTWPMDNPKPQAPKRKRTAKRKDQPMSKTPAASTNKLDERLVQSISESQRVITHSGVKELKQNKLNQTVDKIKTMTQPDVKPNLNQDGQENNLHRQSFQCTQNKPLRQTSINDYWGKIQ